jgi:hypothetical protein
MSQLPIDHNHMMHLQRKLFDDLFDLARGKPQPKQLEWPADAPTPEEIWPDVDQEISEEAVREFERKMAND